MGVKCQASDLRGYALSLSLYLSVVTVAIQAAVVPVGRVDKRSHRLEGQGGPIECES